jgi:uncharacterized protein YndB with AHSA1/START domain
LCVPPETAWPYFSRGELWSLWQGEDRLIEPVPGGRFEVTLAGGIVASGQVLDVAENSRLVFTFGWTGGPVELEPGLTTVEITLAAEPPDGTRIRLNHHGLPTGLRDFNQTSWEQCLTELGSILAAR